MIEKQTGITERLFSSVDRLLNLEPPVNEEVREVYSFRNNDGVQIGWIDLHTRESGNYEPLVYSKSFDTRPENLCRIPPVNQIYSIHFLPPEALAAIKKSTEEEPWYSGDEFVEHSGSIRNKYSSLMVEFLTLIKQKKFPEMEFVVAGTNPRMAEMAFSLGFKRCWKENYNPPDLKRPIPEDADVIIGTSIAELKELYDLDNREPSLDLVNEKVKQYARDRNNARRAARAG